MIHLMNRIREAKGHVSFYYAPLDGGNTMTYNPDEALIAASVIKLPIMIEAFRQMECNMISPEEKHVLQNGEKKPSCGALNRLHEGLELTIMDLVELMIILSDNTATNILIDRLGIENVNHTLRELGMERTVLRRKLFDPEGKAKGLENTVAAREIGQLLEMMYRGTLVSETASAKMLDILKAQRLNGKMPFYLHSRKIAVAHKTGEDDGITHDVGIVFSERPFVLCMLSNETDVPQFERLIQDAADVLSHS